MIKLFSRYFQNILSYKWWLLPLGVALLTVLIFLPFARIGVDFHHEGVMLKPALDVLHGQVLYRDTFTQYGALTTYLDAVALKIYPSLLSLRILTVIAYAIAIFFLAASWMMFLPRSLVLVSYILFLIFIPFYDSHWIFLPWSSTIALMFQSIVIYGLFRCVKGENPVLWGVIIGTNVALVIWCRQPVGLALTAMVVIDFIILKRYVGQVSSIGRGRLWKGFVLSFISVHIIFILVLIISGAIGAWFYQNFIFPFNFYRNIAFPINGAPKGIHLNWLTNVSQLIRPYDGLLVSIIFIGLCFPMTLRNFKFGIHIIYIVIYYILFVIFISFYHRKVLELLSFPAGWSYGHGGLQFFVPLIVIFLGGVFLAWKFIKCRSINKEVYLVIALYFISIASFLQYFPFSDLRHIIWSLAPAFGLFVYFTWNLTRKRTSLVIIVILIIFMPSIIQKINLAKIKISRPRVEIKQPTVLMGMKVAPELAKYIAILDEATHKILDKAPNTPIAIMGDDAMYATFSNNLWNASPFYIDWAGLVSEKDLKFKLLNIYQRRPIVCFQRSSKEVIESFKQKEHYQTIAEIPFQTPIWWWGGQNEADLNNDKDKLPSMVVVAPQELVVDNAGLKVINE